MKNSLIFAVTVTVLAALLLPGQTSKVANAVSMSGTYASLPSGCTAGELFLPTDSLYQMLRCPTTGVPWQHFYRGLQVLPPVLSEFAWINQGASTATVAYGGVQITAPAAAGYNLRILKKVAPATPYTVTVIIDVSLLSANNRGAGLCFRESASGKLALWTLWPQTASNTGWYLHSDKMTDPTTHAASYSQTIYSYEQPVFLRIADDGVNRVCSVSRDDIAYTSIHSVARADFLTADEIGVFVNSASATWGHTVNWLHWKVE